MPIPPRLILPRASVYGARLGFFALRGQQPQGCGGLRGEQQPERGAVGLGLVAPFGAWPQAQQGADAPLEAEGRRKKEQVRRRGDAPGLRRRHELREERVSRYRGDARRSEEYEPEKRAARRAERDRGEACRAEEHPRLVEAKLRYAALSQHRGQLPEQHRSDEVSER